MSVFFLWFTVYMREESCKGIRRVDSSGNKISLYLVKRKSVRSKIADWICARRWKLATANFMNVLDPYCASLYLYTCCSIILAAAHRGSFVTPVWVSQWIPYNGIENGPASEPMSSRGSFRILSRGLNEKTFYDIIQRRCYDGCIDRGF